MPAHPPGEAPQLLGVTAIKPVERHGWEAFKYFFWDPEKRLVMGRTGRSWGLISAFYLVYYTCLAAFWALMLYVFLLTIDGDKPKWIGDTGLIGTSPGLGMRPAQPDSSIDSSMIIFNKDERLFTHDIPGWSLWAKQTSRWLTKSYEYNELKPCVGGRKHADGSACKFDVRRNLGSVCGQEGVHAYGYKIGQPCVYFKLNRIFGVENQPYNGSEPFPDDMPKGLQDHIMSSKVRDKNQVWLDCQGENPADVEAMGTLRYFPEERGFPSVYFPYMNQDNYESPVVAVQFLNATLGQLLHIECRAWAKNIKYVRMDRIGMVRFELFILKEDYVLRMSEEEQEEQHGY